MGAMAIVTADEAVARPFGLGSWGAEAEVRFERDDQDTRIGGTSSEFRRTRYEEQVGLRNRGFFIVDPRLFTGNLEGRFGLVQEDERVDREERFRNGTLLGYSFDGAILSDKPYVVTLFANRNQSVLTREFGGRSEITFENRGGTFRLREDSVLRDLGFPYFSAVLGAREERLKEETTALGRTFRRDEVRTVLSYEASKGFETSDLSLRYEFADLDDRQGVIGSFRTHTAGLTYSLDFGPTLNRRWDSRLQYLNRTGRNPVTFFSADEELRLDHHADLVTDYRYLFSRNEAGVGDTTTHTGIAFLQHRLYESLTSRLAASGTLQDFPAGERISTYGEADFAYRRAIPRRGQLFAGTGGRYQIDDNRFRLPLVAVIDEPHTAPTPLGLGAGFTLNNPFVVVSTIVVRNAVTGVQATLGVDYLIVQEGDFTKIVPLAGGVIVGGDPLLVSYSFEVNPSLKFSTLSWHGTLGVDYRWIALTAAHRQSDQDRVSGKDGRFLDDRTSDSVRLDLRGDWDRVRAVATAEYQVEDSTRLDFTAWQFSQSVSYRPLLDLLLSLSSQESFTEFTRPRRRSESLSTRGTLDWSPLTGLFVTGFLGLRVFDDSEVPSETIREAGLRARWTFARLEVAPAFTWSDRERGVAETTNLRFDVRVVRRFF
jgi:hypothetical protein